VTIVVITGTHEQPFDRLVAAADRLAALGHDVFVQYGYASRPPDIAEGAAWVSRQELGLRCSAADLIITHGGPGAIWDAFGAGLVPIVVPRSVRHGEHVDDHQVAFARHLARHGRAIVVEDALRLERAVAEYPSAARGRTAGTEAARRHRSGLAATLDAWAEQHLASRKGRR
jgi:UDP-N-acetylglucosamine transferase subunit ALG13